MPSPTVERLAPDAPDDIQAEAVIRMAAYAYGLPDGGPEHRLCERLAQQRRVGHVCALDRQAGAVAMIYGVN